jgi:thioredoxin reductase (NADPH)
LTQAPEPTIETDAVVIGAGPVGLFQAFQLGLLEVAVHIVDALPAPGGQCIELYPDKPIYDIPGVPVLSGRELAERLLVQIRPFNFQLHLGHQVSALERQADGRFALKTARGTRFLSRFVFIAAGVGAFQPRALKVPGIERHVGKQLHYRSPPNAALAGRHVAVFGDDDAALCEALELAHEESHRPASVTLVHRRDAFSASADTVARMRAACAAGQMAFVAAQPVAIEETDGRLAALSLACADGSDRRLPVDVVLALLGLSPKLGPVADWGLAMERRQVVVDTERFETSVEGIYAVGDINTYPGKRKLIVCGFHEATLAAYAAAQRLQPDRPLLQQYTTTSPRLQKLLGVAKE